MRKIICFNHDGSGGGAANVAAQPLLEKQDEKAIERIKLTHALSRYVESGLVADAACAIAAGADVNTVINGKTFLMRAGVRPDVKMVKALLEVKARKDLKDDDGKLAVELVREARENYVQTCINGMAIDDAKASEITAKITAYDSIISLLKDE